MTPQYRIDQLSLTTWRLSVADEGGWRQVDVYGSQAAAMAAMSAVVTASQFAAPPPQYFDATGALMIQPVLP